MKTIGLIGGMSWESTAEYYRIINQCVRQRLGGLHSAPCVLWSFDFSEIDALQRREAWEVAGRRMIAAARALERAGAELLLICTNTMHMLADAVQREVRIPLLHIADATADAIHAAGLTRVGLLATRFTMERDFYRQRLNQRCRLEVLIPDEDDRATVHAVIYNELCCGCVRDESRARLGAVIGRLAQAGAQGVILGCTELGLLLGPEDSPLPLFDTTRIHAQAAVNRALA